MHKIIAEIIEGGKPLPFELENACIYYAGPTQSPEHLPIGSCGPTTSSRMDKFSPLLMQNGLRVMIGKGERNQSVVDAIVQHKAIYLCAIGGAGALACECIKSCEIVAFEELGCESAKKLYVENFPLIVGVDCNGNSIYKR